MKTTIQPGMHPDAEILNAFAEQLLPAPEREQILAHMATCSRCREVVFLAQHAAAEEQPEPAPVVARVKEARRSWFAGWRLAWVPVAALAGFVGFAVVQHYRHAAPETEMAGNVSQTRAQQKPEAAQAPAVIEKQAQPVKERQAEARSKAPAREAAKNQKDAGKNLDELKQIARRDAELGATGTVAKTEGTVAGGPIHGTLTSRADGVSIGGPMANQLQQNANQIQEQNAAPQQNPLPLTQNNELASANRPTAKAAPGAASETVTGQAESKPVAAPPPAAQQLSLSTVATRSVDVASDKLAKKAKHLMLPSGLSALSSASAAKRTIAIDPAGALFLSEDSGKHWQAIPTQWTGRAVLVRVRQAATQPAVLAGVRRAQFELVNDKLQTWVSEDGKTWIPQAVGPN